MLSIKKYLVIIFIIKILTLIYYDIYFRFVKKQEFEKNTQFYKDIFNIDLSISIIVILLLIMSYLNIKYLPFFTISYLNFTMRAIYNFVKYRRFIGIWQLFTTIFELFFAIKNKLL